LGINSFLQADREAQQLLSFFIFILPPPFVVNWFKDRFATKGYGNHEHFYNLLA
jgi:hypothetical protein